MARPTIEQLRGLGDFATTYQWSLSFALSPQAFAFSEDFNLRCLTAEVPKVTNEPIDIRIRGHHIKQPGISDSTHTITLTFQETVDSYISTGILLWRNACQEMITGIQQSNEVVKANILLNRLDRQDNIIWSYLLRGCFLEDYDPVGGELNSDTGLITPSMTLSYDYHIDGPSGALLNI